jgi:hypothetical protein
MRHLRGCWKRNPCFDGAEPRSQKRDLGHPASWSKRGLSFWGCVMKTWATGILVYLAYLFATAAAASAQNAAPMPDISSLIQQTIVQQRLAESMEKDFLFREDVNDIRLNKECTWAPQCPVPFGTPGKAGVAFLAISNTAKQFDVFWVDGVRVTRLLTDCKSCGSGGGAAGSSVGGQFPSDDEIDREVAEAKAMHAKGKLDRSQEGPPQILLSRLLEFCTFLNPRRQAGGGRPVILLDFSCDRSKAPGSEGESILENFSGTIGIDERDHAVEKMEGSFSADVSLSDGAIKIRKGTRVTITNRRMEDGVWMLSRLDARGEGRYYSFSINGDGHISIPSYRRFSSTSRIITGTEEEPTGPVVPSSPASPPR